jgi:hypothetical protein
MSAFPSPLYSGERGDRVQPRIDTLFGFHQAYSEINP